MNNHLPLITCDDETTFAPVMVSFLSLQTNKSLFIKETLPDKEFLDTLVFRVTKKPKCLLTHVQRIYYCYQAQLGEQLYAALVDFLIVLNRRGFAISRRVVTGARSALSVMQMKILQRYLLDANVNMQLLPGNRYSIFSKGIIGTTQVVQLIENKQQADIDPLVLARDFVNYSQLAEAQAVLEDAILEQPGRLELHEELLAIYRSARNATGFQQMLSKLTQAGYPLPEDWQIMDAYFKELN